MKNYSLLFALLAITSQQGYADSLTLEQSTKTLDPLISSVITCGDWTYQDKHGTYRIVSGWLWGHSELYVQWLTDAEWDKKKIKGNQQVGIPVVLASVSFPEYDAYEADTDLANIGCIKKDGHWLINADAESEEGKFHISIELGAEPGKYTLDKSPAKL